MDLEVIFNKVDFVNRYKHICEKHNDFENSMIGVKNSLCKDIFNKLGYTFKYFSNGSFYQIKHEHKNVRTQLHLVLKNGIVETLLYLFIDDIAIQPKGRIDFIPQKIGVDFDRKKYKLPRYSTESELEEIVRDILLIYDDINNQLFCEIN